MPARNLTRKLIDSHLVDGRAVAGEEIGLRIDQTLAQDATGTVVMLEFEAMGIPRVRTELSVQYVDHNLLQTDYRNPDDHLFLESACRKFGIWYSPPGNGVSHPVHMERLGVPGKTLLGADSHTCAAGALAMLAIGAGGLQVALAMAGEPFHVRMPQVWGVRLTGELPDWVSAKDVILEMLRRHDVDGGVGRIVEYYGPGLAQLSAMDRHVIANMGAELGATTSVFPSDERTRAFLRRQGRGSTRPAATAASAWARPRPRAGSACARCRATSPAARARWRIRSTCAAPRPPPPRPCAVRSPTDRPKLRERDRRSPSIARAKPAVQPSGAAGR